MTETNIGRLNKLPFRDVWKDEAKDFTPWLKDHIDQLADELNMKLEAQSTEVSVGKYSLDLLAINPETQGNVVIENQVGNADHDHLGKLITYAAGLKAEIAIWIAERFGDEHRAALEWLNESGPAGAAFFGVEIQAVNIDGSIPAAMFRTILTPHEWSRTRDPVPGELSETQKEYVAYWKPLLEELKTAHKWGPIQTDNKNRFYSAGSGLGQGFGNFRRTMRFAGKDEIRVEFIFWGPNKEWNKQAFDLLMESRETIEDATGPLTWERLTNSMISRVAAVRKGTRGDAEPELDEHRHWMIGQLTTLPQTLRPYLEQVQQAMNEEEQETTETSQAMLGY